MIERKFSLRTAIPIDFIGRRIKQEARILDRTATMTARIELANEALSKVILHAYQNDGVDPVTKRLTFPLPWGSKGWKKYGLRRHEARTLCSILLKRQEEWTPSQRPLLFVFDHSSRRWLLNTDDWMTLQHAMFWLSHSEIRMSEWVVE